MNDKHMKYIYIQNPGKINVTHIRDSKHRSENKQLPISNKDLEKNVIVHVLKSN